MLKILIIGLVFYFAYKLNIFVFYGLFLILGIIALYFILNAFPLRFPRYKVDASKLDIFFGAPGSGKTTLAAFFAAKALVAGVPVYSNVPIIGAYQLDKKDIGVWNIEGPALVIFDEAGAEFNSRNFKSNFTIEQIKWYKFHRHEGCQVMIFSQGFDDMDKILRTLSTRLWVVRKAGSIIQYRAINKTPDIDELQHTPIDFYDWKRFSKRWIYAPSVWKYFDSWTRLNLPDKPLWEKWGSDQASL